MDSVIHVKLECANWDILIYYTVNERQKEEVVHKLKEYKCDESTLNSVITNLKNSCTDTGFTYSSFSNKCSLIVIHKASSIGELINTFEHEKNHLEMHICEALGINPYSEEAAHMSGNIAQLIFEQVLYSIVEL